MKEPIESILVVGDSLSRGVVYNEDKHRYCFLKDSYINLMGEILMPQVYNTAKFGTTVRYGQKVLAEELSKRNPDVVLIEFGGNDCDFDWEEIARHPDDAHDPKTPLREFETRLTQTVQLVRGAGKIPLLMNLPPLNAPDYFAWFTQGDAKKGGEILKWLGDVGKIYWWHERYSATIGRVARRTGTKLIDVRGEFLAEEDFRRYLCVDGIHPNERGHRLIAKAVRDFARRYAEGIFIPGYRPAFV